MAQCQAATCMELGSGGVAAHVFAPRHFAGTLAEMRPGDMVMLTYLRASLPGDIAFGLVRAGAIFAVGFPMIDPLHFEGRMKIVPSSSPRRHGQCCLWRRDDEVIGTASVSCFTTAVTVRAAPLAHHHDATALAAFGIVGVDADRRERKSMIFSGRTWPPNHPPSISTTPLTRVVAKFAVKAHRSLCSKTNAVFACSPR